LNNVGPLLAVVLVIRTDALDVGQVTAYVDTTSPVGVLAGLDDPHFLTHLGVSDDIGGAVWVVEHGLESFEFFTVDSLGNVEGQGQVIEHVLASGVVVDLHVVVEGLLVGQVPV